MNSNSDFTQGSIFKKMVLFMVPILGALILQAMYGAVDTLVVGRFGTTEGLSGVSTGSNVINLVTFTIAGLSTGLTILIGRYLGERRQEKIGKAIGGAIVLFTAISLVLMVVLLIFAPFFATLMQAPAEALDDTVLYIRICGGGIFFIIAYNLISGIFRGMGDSRMPLIFVAIACVVNIFGDLLFIAVLQMNVAGAALATVLAQAVSVILSVIIIRKRTLPFTMTRKDLRINSEVKKFVLIGLPIGFQEIMVQVSFLALCAFINRLGLEASSGYGVASKITAFIMLVPSSLMQSMSSFVSQNVGAAKEKRALKAMLTGMGIGAVIGIVIFAFAYLRGDLLAGAFSEDAAVVARAYEYLRGFAPEAVVTAILFSYMGYYNGHSQTFFVMCQSLAQTFIVRLPMSYYMSIQPNASLQDIGLAAPTATVFGILLNSIYLVVMLKKLKKNDAI